VPITKEEYPELIRGCFHEQISPDLIYTAEALLIRIKPTQSCPGRKLGQSASPLSPKKKGATLIIVTRRGLGPICYLQPVCVVLQ